MDTLDRCDFRPFVAEDDGARLVLLRPRTAKYWATRGALYLLLLLLLGLLAVAPYGAWSKYQRYGDVIGLLGLPVLLLLVWFAMRLLLFGLRLEAAQRIVCRPGELELEGRGALRRRHQRIRDVAALVAHTVRTDTQYGPIRWLHLRVRAAGELTDLGYLELDREAEPEREAQVRAAAAWMAARLQAPLELRDEDGRLVAPP